MPYQQYQMYPYTPYQQNPYMPYQPYQMYPYTPYQQNPYMPYQQYPYTPYQPYQQYPYNPYQQYPYSPYQQYPFNLYQQPTQPQFQTTDNSYTASNNGDDVDVDEGETIGIILESNASTGYLWQLDTDELDDDVVSKVSSQYYQGGTLLGAGGYEQWIFEAEEPGETTIRLEYKRSGETSAASTFEIDVTVEE
jgi:predicted secreted protein